LRTPPVTSSGTSWRTCESPARPECGPYNYVEDVDETIDKLVAKGGEVVTPAYPEGDLRVATFRDPGGNVMGIWQRVTGR
jgi:uncharacterized protein